MRKDRRGSLQLLSRECLWRAPLVPKAQQAFQDLQDQLDPWALWETLGREDHLAVQVFQEQMVYQDHQGQCLCCLSALAEEETLARKDRSFQPRRPKPKPSCSRPGWRCEDLRAQWV